jgi:hypothetical protein
MIGKPARAARRTFLLGPLGFLAALLSGCSPAATDEPPSSAGMDISSELTETQQSEHFEFYYSPGDKVDVARTEAFYAWISGQLAVELETRIQYLKFRNKQQKQSLTGYGGNAEAYPSVNIVSTIWSWDNHEITHVLTYRIGEPTALFNEGIAVANQVSPSDNSTTPTWNMIPLHRCAQDLLASGKLPSLAGLVETDAFRAADPDVTYPTVGSFVEYLIEQYGLPRVLQLFPGATPLDSATVVGARFQQVFGIPFSTAEQDWLAFLQGH